MRRALQAAFVLIAGLLVALVWFAWPREVTVVLPEGHDPADPALVDKGRYLVRAAGCVTCHTRAGGTDQAPGAPYAGGYELRTPFGTFVTPNITRDVETGIGLWSDLDFVRAVRHGLTPDGTPYYPAFPYTSYRQMRVEDALAIKAFLFSLEPVRNPVEEHMLTFPFWWRPLVNGWRLLFFEDRDFAPDAAHDDLLRRGAYLAEALGHCGECHTPRNLLGGPRRSLKFAGTRNGPDGELVPNITPHDATGIGEWSVADVAFLLETGLKPDFDDVQGSMWDVVEDSSKHLTADDRRAIGAYVLSLPPIDHRVEARRSGGGGD